VATTTWGTVRPRSRTNLDVDTGKTGETKLGEQNEEEMLL